MDPYYGVQDEIRDRLEALSRQSKYNDLDGSAKELSDQIRDLEVDLCELEATVRAVELEPAKFPHITSFEARARREFIEQTQHELTRLKNGISSVEIQQKMAPVFPQPKSIRRQDPSIRPSIAEVPKPSFVFQSNRIDIDDPLKKSSLFFGMQSEQQQLLLAEQDRTLDELASATEKLNETAVIVNTELIDQQRMLVELDEDIERETEHMGTVMRQMARILKTSNRVQLCAVLWLFIIFLFLLILVIS